ncbi:restriction endonuclease subunit S [Aeromonas allosaccharophila]|uniref:restriction endonuclease subunit S n=1 Tax=Aeromonas allosaccharophila TaxID=656 RepID=UPI00214BE8A8|nr:restriction endonuclease subunit S [Aeromonas allosaccharophila]
MAALKIENLITDHLDLWSAAVRPKSSAGRGSNSKLELTGIKKLRELILELAVRGKLVPQDPNDEPASVLLERIAVEKARLVKEKKIKKEKPLSAISEDEKLFELPNGWEWCRLSELGVFFGGKTPSKMKSDYWGGDIPWVTPKDMKVDYIIESEDYVTDIAVDDGLTLVKPNSLLFVARSGILRRKFPVAITTVTCTVNQDLKVLQPFDCGLAPYIHLMMKGFEKYILKNLTKVGTTVESLVFDEFSINPFILPPLFEQHRIVAKVGELMALCDQLEQRSESQSAAHQTLVETLLATLTDSSDADELVQNWARLSTHFDTLFTTEASIDALKQTILQLAVMGKLVPQDPSDEPASVLLERIAAEKAQLVKEGKIKKQKPQSVLTEEEKAFELPNGWKWVRLQQLVTLLGDGLHGTPSYDENGDYFFVNGNNLDNGRIIIKPDTKRVNKLEFEKYKKNLTDRTILVSINGSLGKVGFYAGEKIVLGKSACYFNLSDLLSKVYFKRVIESSYFTDYAFSKATGSTIKNLGLKAMNEFPIALPPIEEMKRIISRVEQLIALCDQLKVRLQTSQQTQLALAESLVEGALA